MIVGVGLVWRPSQGKAPARCPHSADGREEVLPGVWSRDSTKGKRVLMCRHADVKLKTSGLTLSRVVEKAQKKELLGDGGRGGGDGGGGKHTGQDRAFPMPSFLPVASMHAFSLQRSLSFLLSPFLAPCSFYCLFPCYLLCCMRGGGGGIVPCVR